MSYCMLCPSSNTNPTSDQSMIHQHRHSIDISFQDRSQLFPLHYLLMDHSLSFPMNHFNATSNSTTHSQGEHEIPSPNPGNKNHQPILTSSRNIHQLQDNLDYLQDEWAAIDIVLSSLKTAFPVHPIEATTEEHLDNVDRELGIAYDDLMAQVRSLDRNLKRLDNRIKSCRSSGSSV